MTQGNNPPTARWNWRLLFIGGGLAAALLIAVAKVIIALSGATTSAATTATPGPTPTAISIAALLEANASPTPILAPTVERTITAASASTAISTISAVSTNKGWTPVVQTIAGVEMVLVPPGCFMMGSEGGDADEKPLNKQCFDAPFWIDKTEVIQAQFKQFGGVAATRPTFAGDNRPVESITWLEARDFCARRGGRLPTEAEWEYAARGPDDLIYPWGNAFDAKQTISNRTSDDGTADVGSIPGGASWVGALDMSGNVWEWVSSIYKPYPYNKDDGRENNNDTSSARVLRSGSWDNTDAASFRTTIRLGLSPANEDPTFGFRCARAF